MSKLKKQRQKLNLTQEELSEKSGITLSTIQGIESGDETKDQTIKALANTLGINESELIEKEEFPREINFTLMKVINLSSLPFTVIPPANIIIPLIIMFDRRQFNRLAKQIVSIQILWLILAVIILILSSYIKSWFSLQSSFMLTVMIFLVLSNILVILRNTAEIERKGKLFFRLNFNLI